MTKQWAFGPNFISVFFTTIDSNLPPLAANMTNIVSNMMNYDLSNKISFVLTGNIDL